MESGTMRRRLKALSIASAIAMTAAAAPQAVAALQPAAASGGQSSGKLANGTRYVLYQPANWNGVLVLNPDLEGRSAAASDALHAMGYATGNRARDITNWQIRAGSTDLLQLKSLFTDKYGRPKRTIVIGGSLGGLITRDVGETYPTEIDGVVPTCGGGAGLIAMYNNRLDVAFAVKTLLANDDAAVELDRIKDDKRNSATMQAAVERASKAPIGRARIALIGAIAQISGWPMNAPQPAADDYEPQLKTMAAAEAGILNLKADVESAAGGSFSWNTGIDYAAMFRQADPAAIAMTRALYRQAGGDLNADLAALGAAPRRQADAEAVAWARNNGVSDGRLRIPTLALYTAADPRAPLSEYRAYQLIVDKAGASGLLRQIGVKRSGHCNFQASERLAAVQLMDERLSSGRWPTVTPASMNARATALAARYKDLGAPAFSAFPGTPVYPRQFNADDAVPAGAVKP